MKAGVCIGGNLEGGGHRDLEAESRKDAQRSGRRFSIHQPAHTSLPLGLSPVNVYMAVSENPAGAVTWWPQLGLRD